MEESEVKHLMRLTQYLIKMNQLRNLEQAKGYQMVLLREAQEIVANKKYKY